MLPTHRMELLVKRAVWWVVESHRETVYLGHVHLLGKLRLGYTSAQSDQSSLVSLWMAKDPRCLLADSDGWLQILGSQVGIPAWPRSWPRWLSLMSVRLVISRLRVRVPQMSNILLWRLIMKYFLESFSPSRWYKKCICQFLVKECT